MPAPNPPAFPSEKPAIVAGMTLRDYFAAKAMQAYLTESYPIEDAIPMAYQAADAMLAERSK